MISEGAPTADRAYVWVWLPGAVVPVVAGLLRRDRQGGYGFVYGRSYLGRDTPLAGLSRVSLGAAGADGVLPTPHGRVLPEDTGGHFSQ